MQVAVIMRGIPGSGKSSFNRVLKELCNQNGISLIIHSTDEYFMVDGKYIFDQKKLGYYHKLNKLAFDESLGANISIVTVDNTNLRQREYGDYIKSARDVGAYVVAVVFYPDEPENHFKRQTHGVPLDVLNSMIEKFSNNKVTVGVDLEIPIYPEKFCEQRLRTVAERIIQIVIGEKKDTQ
jgi:tRNA uridine 5-carbamoylmethylation protein Kti12